MTTRELVTLEDARKELEQSSPPRSRGAAKDAAAVGGAALLGLLMAGLAAVVGSSLWGATSIGAAAGAAAAASLGFRRAAKEARDRQLASSRFSIRILLLSSIGRRLTRSEIRRLVEAWGTLGDPELDCEIRVRLLEEFSDSEG